MKRNIGPERGLRIITDLCDPNIDTARLLAKYRIDREDLSRWMLTDRTQRTLAGLCLLADYQAQLILSHHRVSAVYRLVEMLTDPKPKRDENGEQLPTPKPLNAEIVRKACVDILRLNMDKAPMLPADDGDEQTASPTNMIRKLLYESAQRQEQRSQSGAPQ